MRKPDSCKGCPFYGDGNGFVPDERIENAPVVVMGQNPGANEEAEAKPFVGATGEQMMRSFFPTAGLVRGDNVSIGNAIRCRVNRSNELPDFRKDPRMKVAIEHCTRAHWKRPEGATLIVAQGDKALYAMTGEGVQGLSRCHIADCACKRRMVGDWRGWLLPYNPVPMPTLVHGDVYQPTPHDISVLATYHLAYLFRDPTAKAPTQRDWVKVPYILKGRWPEPMPRIERVPPDVWPRKAAFDTEYTWGARDNKLLRYSLAWRETWRDGQPNLYVVEAESVLDHPHVTERPTLILHNAEADLPFIPAVTGTDDFDIEDTMYSAAVLWSDLDKDLDFRSSLYARTNRWKHLVHTNPVAYSGGDALGTWDVWAADEKEFARDPRSEWVYRNVMLPLVPIISKGRRHGFAVHQGFVQEAKVKLEERLHDATWKAQAAVGWPINLGSTHQLAHQIYNVEKANQQGFRRPKK